MKCFACCNEIVSGVSCIDCMNKATQECIQSQIEMMQLLDKHLTIDGYITTHKSYKQNRNNYNYARLELLYLTGEIPRPTFKKKNITLGQRRY